MLIRVPEHTPADLARWEKDELADQYHAQTHLYKNRVQLAKKEIFNFANLHKNACYASVSWGKDSTVLAHLIVTSGLDIPLVWIRVKPYDNPHCKNVRDMFLAKYYCRYIEIVREAQKVNGKWTREGTGILEEGFKQANHLYGPAYFSGVRGQESTSRSKRMSVFGMSSKLTCAPLGYFSGDDIFAYLYEHNLPVHPAYAMLLNGILDRRRMRVATLGGERGRGHGRNEIEQFYYRWRLRQIENETPFGL